MIGGAGGATFKEEFSEPIAGTDRFGRSARPKHAAPKTIEREIDVRVTRVVKSLMVVPPARFLAPDDHDIRRTELIH